MLSEITKASPMNRYCLASLLLHTHPLFSQEPGLFQGTIVLECVRYYLDSKFLSTGRWSDARYTTCRRLVPSLAACLTSSKADERGSRRS